MQNKLFIGGQWLAPDLGESFEVVDPATEKVIHYVPPGNSHGIDAAVTATKTAFDAGPWPRMRGKERAGYLRAMEAEITERLEEPSELEVLEPNSYTKNPGAGTSNR